MVAMCSTSTVVKRRVPVRHKRTLTSRWHHRGAQWNAFSSVTVARIESDINGRSTSIKPRVCLD